MITYLKLIKQNSLSSLVDNLSESKKTSQAELINKFLNTYQLCNKDFNKYTLSLTKGVYPDKYMDGWEKFNETS